MNAALPAKKALEEVAQRVGLDTVTSCSFAFYDLDTDKNVLDYLTFLKVSPTTNEFSQMDRHNIRQFLYPAVVVLSMFTTIFALSGISHGWLCRSYVVGCFGIQLLFSVRPVTRSIRRFRGINVDI